MKAEYQRRALGVTDRSGVPIHKPWLVYTNCSDLAIELNKHRCPNCPQHAICEGAETEGTGRYTKTVGRVIHRCWANTRACGNAAAVANDEMK